jgi:hypothetical protein
VALKSLKSIWHFILLRIIPDYLYINYRYFRIFGRFPNLRHPRTLNEKIQASKLYDRDPLYTILADKYRVRQYIMDSIGGEYLIPLIGVYSSVEDLFCEFPEDYPFIIKPNHDSGGGIIIRGPADVNRDEIRSTLTRRLSRNFYYETKEWEYKNIRPLIVVERLLTKSDGDIPNDYKINCFSGRCEFIYCSIDRGGRNYRRIYDRNWIGIDMTWCARGLETKKFSGPDITKPQNFEKMIEIAEKLSSRFNYIRVDLYNVDGKIYFGELTRHHGGGYEPILPTELDGHYGSLIAGIKN